jgi:hypothetical protein
MKLNISGLIYNLTGEIKVTIILYFAVPHGFPWTAHSPHGVLMECSWSAHGLFIVLMECSQSLCGVLMESLWSAHGVCGVLMESLWSAHGVRGVLMDSMSTLICLVKFTLWECSS